MFKKEARIKNDKTINTILKEINMIARIHQNIVVKLCDKKSQVFAVSCIDNMTYSKKENCILLEKTIGEQTITTIALKRDSIHTISCESESKPDQNLEKDIETLIVSIKLNNTSRFI